MVRARQIDYPEEWGGSPCLPPTQGENCNTQACDKDCELSAWSAWSPCTMSCRPHYKRAVGTHQSKRSISAPTIAGGQCWRSREPERFKTEKCNNFACPPRIECIAPIDLVFVQDGSGSVGRRGFATAKRFIEKMITDSKMATTDDFAAGVRYGVVLYSRSAKVITQLDHDKTKILAALKSKMIFRGGSTNTGGGLVLAAKLFQAQHSNLRLQTMVLITDGRANNRRTAYKGATTVKDSGIRLMVIPVKRAARNRAMMCSWASYPCSQNMIFTPQWWMLTAKLKDYMAGICPTVQCKGHCPGMV